MDNNKVQKNRENWKKKRRMRLIKSLIVIAVLILAGAGVLAGLAINRENRRKAAEKAALREAIEEEEAKLAARRALIEKADYLALGYDYDGAINLLMQEENYENDSELAHAISGYVVSRSQLVAKDVTEVPHIFFHSLIVLCCIPVRSASSFCVIESCCNRSKILSLIVIIMSSTFRKFF